LGLPWYGGAPRKPERVRSMAEKAVALIEDEVRELEARLPQDVMLAPLEELNGAELMARGSLEGLRQLNRIIAQPMDIEGTIREQDVFGLKQQRLVGDMAHALLKQARERAEGERNYDLIGRLLAAMAAEKAEE
jgi:hypothetical protein